MREAVATAATLVKGVVQSVELSHRIEAEEPIDLLVAEILVADLGDGVFFRWFDADGPFRRMADGAADKLTMGSALRAGYKVNPTARPYIAALAAREAFVSVGNTTHLLRKEEVIKGGTLHKLASLSVAAFVVAASHRNETATHVTGSVAAILNGALAADYHRAWSRQDHGGKLESGVREIPGFYSLRRLIGHDSVK